jgi:FtsP/CotA-like multicopper oxidase with cupredoxin domain
MCALASAFCAQGAALALDNPVKFESRDGRLDLIVTATTSSVRFGGVTTTGWVYEVCRRESRTATSCLPGTIQNPYGGVWLHLRRNDTLHIRLVNKLPPVPDAKHCNADLANNPTNLHTHGLIVEPYRGNPYGDYVFVEVRNPANASHCQPTRHASRRPPAPEAGGMHGAASGGAHPDMDAADGAVEYAIHLVNHPAGLFWFHPHVHGVALNQVTSGLAGVITVGEPADACGDADCRAAIEASRSHLLVLKDSEVLADGTLLNQQDASFCPPTIVAGEAPRQGMCAGDAQHAGGHWFHTINGQLYPSIDVGGNGAIWRIVNAAGSRSYDLSLAPDGGGEPVPLQVLSIDGITIDSALAANMSALQVQLGRKVDLFRCPDAPGARVGAAVCTRHIRMMPSSRATVRVLNDRAGARHAVLRTDHYDTGGDDWPAVDLASVALAPPAASVPMALNIASGAKDALSPTGVLGATSSLAQPGADRPMPLDQVRSQASAREPGAPSPGLRLAPEFAIDAPLKLGLRRDPDCANLAPGEHRRIYFGNPTPGKDGFGLATSVIGADGQEKHVTPMRAFDATKTTICLTASGDNENPTKETWEIYNLTDEDHNFHVHQTRFWLSSAAPGQSQGADEALVLQDNVPLTHAQDAKNCDGSIANFKSKACQPQAVWARIPFTQIGDFVFHCHILEHEDGGMMARIRVVAPPLIQGRN